jgi:hypothetical protein
VCVCVCVCVWGGGASIQNVLREMHRRRKVIKPFFFIKISYIYTCPICNGYGVVGI